jgi:hypothetical protein
VRPMRPDHSIWYAVDAETGAATQPQVAKITSG